MHGRGPLYRNIIRSPFSCLTNEIKHSCISVTSFTKKPRKYLEKSSEDKQNFQHGLMAQLGLIVPNRKFIKHFKQQKLPEKFQHNLEEEKLSNEYPYPHI